MSDIRVFRTGFYTSVGLLILAVAGLTYYRHKATHRVIIGPGDPPVIIHGGSSHVNLAAKTPSANPTISSKLIVVEDDNPNSMFGANASSAAPGYMPLDGGSPFPSPPAPAAPLKPGWTIMVCDSYGPKNTCATSITFCESDTKGNCSIGGGFVAAKSTKDFKLLGAFQQFDGQFPYKLMDDPHPRFVTITDNSTSPSTSHSYQCVGSTSQPVNDPPDWTDCYIKIGTDN